MPGCSTPPISPPQGWLERARASLSTSRKERTLAQLADMVCGNSEPGVPCFFRYRSSSYLTEFFEDCDTDYRHDGSTRKWWVAGTLRQILSEPQPYPNK